jgi:hypothetical protein
VTIAGAQKPGHEKGDSKMTINYNLKSAERKPLVAAASEILETKAEYHGVKGGYGYQIGEYHIDRNGVLT